MGRKEDYKKQNEQFLEALRSEQDIKELAAGVLYRVLEAGQEGDTPRLNSIVSVHVGDRWMIYIPYTVGYGTRSSGPIPAYSTLIFEVHLLSIA